MYKKRFRKFLHKIKIHLYKKNLKNLNTKKKINVFY